MSLTSHLVISLDAAVPVVKGWGFETTQEGVHVKLTSQHGVMMEASSRPHNSFCLGNCKLEILGSPRLFDGASSSCASRTVTTIISRQPSFRKSGEVGSWYEVIRCMVAHGRSWWTVFQGGEGLAMLLF
jgi:hypothetical protein